jgi:hypothetical protein
MRRTIRDSRKSSDIRLDISERAGIQRQELRGNGKDARDRFGMKGN